MRSKLTMLWGVGGFILLTGLVLWLPVDWALEALELHRVRRRHVLAVLAILLALVVMLGLIRQRWLWSVVLIGVVVAVMVRLTYFGLVHFSGAGFSDDFFNHLEWQSVQVTFKEYGSWLLLALVAMVALVGLGVLAHQRRPKWSLWPAAVALGFSLLVLAATRAVLPEWQLIRAWQAWSEPLAMEISADRRRAFTRLNVLDTEVVPKRRVRATAAEQPKNLILVYLESVGVNLANREDWPGLMPNLEQLMAEHAWLDHMWTSSYTTIEGITNSQCGTLFSFRRGSDSLAEGDRLAEELPCLGDVLHRAGYHQVYMGGAGMGFAGKGNFLAAHGYDELLGLEHWREQGLSQRPGKWGLSDAELFDLSIAEIRRLRQSGQPFNLTLLTIGTHLPGYLYRECEPYVYGEHRFLDALHCSDQLLGRWLDRLQAENLLEDTVVVITADHHVFPNPDMRGLFGEDVLDRRLPFIVLGDELLSPAHATGAGYDLAPTVLDLLGVEHNARFMLGRSLVTRNTRPDYFLKRYGAIHDQRVTRPGDVPCADAPRARLTLPLTDCERSELLGLIHSTLVVASQQLSQVVCEPAGDVSSNWVSLPNDADAPLQLVIGGEPQAERFVFRSRPVPATRRGLYGLVLNEHGEVLRRRFVPLSYAQGTVPEDWFDEPGGHEWVILRHVGGRDSAIPPSIEIRDQLGQTVMQRALVNEETGSVELDLSVRFCPEYSD